ncbi:hypothetical protein LCGC14_0806140 [marine sediment metagenome]|uniref:Uncharacterized protein n=1 Tax=marine sediment metagenome TaxID=412755 RepID=A0A0F9PSR6_9ZZZZ
MACIFKEDGICYNVDMISGEECIFPNNKKCPETYQNIDEDDF